jgi:hypothetical protein
MVFLHAVKGPHPLLRGPPSPEEERGQLGARYCSFSARRRGTIAQQWWMRSLKADEGKKERIVPLRLSACMQWCCKNLLFGWKPEMRIFPCGKSAGTQRFWPELQIQPNVPHFSYGSVSRVRALGAAQGSPGGGRCASEGAWSVVSTGLAPGSRKQMALHHRLAGAASGSGSFDKFATLTSPFQNQ